MSKRSRDIFLILKRFFIELFFAVLLAFMLLGTGKVTHAVVNIGGLESGMIRVVIEIIDLFFIVMAALTFGLYFLKLCHNVIRDIITFRRDSLPTEILGTKEKAEKWAIALGWWIPRKYRGDILGDIMEDCREMRKMDCGEFRIRIQVLWQWVIAVMKLVPSAIFGGIWRIFSPSK